MIETALNGARRPRKFCPVVVWCSPPCVCRTSCVSYVVCGRLDITHKSAGDPARAARTLHLHPGEPRRYCRLRRRQTNRASGVHGVPSKLKALPFCWQLCVLHLRRWLHGLPPRRACPRTRPPVRNATVVIAFAFALAALALCERGSRVICFPLPSSRRGTRPTACRVDRRGRLPAVVIGRAVIFVLQPVGSPTGWVKGAARCFPRQHFRPLAPRYRAESTLLPWIGTVASGHNCVSGCHEFVTTTPVCTYAPAGARLPLRSHRILFLIYRCHVWGCTRD